MFSFFFDCLSWAAESVLSILRFLIEGAFSVLSALASLFLAPLKSGLSSAGSWFGIPISWTPLFFLAAVFLLLVFLVLMGWAFSYLKKHK